MSSRSSVTQDRGLAALLALITTGDLPWTVRRGALRVE